eukprot:CAMPEP_0181060926 /NCGR_PEP_ID=MMETSP1070-20121207/22239_1 /TAXON_ID=265543 /ORGANISM="Minutocellus polymorphus, Strain NH13" /LENGTH=974 /DNA_ID=CAMNT_0023140829 /DNA_START=44 /DNA_END=2969 /DNA_ORIENTATION=-
MSGGPPFGGGGGGGGGGFGYPRTSSSSSNRRKAPKNLPDALVASAASGVVQSEEQDTAAARAAASLALAAQEEARDNAEWNNLNRWGQMTNTIAAYRRIEQIGEGTYGQVYRAQCLSSGREVALKKIRVTHPGYFGMPPTIIREIKILKALHHRNMVEMVEVVSSKGVEDLDEDDEREDDARRRAKRHRADQQQQREREKLARDGGEADGGEYTGGDDRTDGSASSPAGAGAGADGSGKKVKKSNSSGDMTLKTTKTASAPAATSTSKKSHSSSAANNNPHNPNKKDRIVDAREGYKGNLFIVLEYVSHDLTGLIDMQVKFTEVQIKTIFRQLLDVLDYMHAAKYVHRDIKSSNILIDSHFRVKLADFGLARCIAPPVWDQPSDEQGLTGNRDLTNKVITLWYRPPELLLGESRYGCAVDIWSAGCILAELINGRPLFTGKSEMEQLSLIFDMIGTPTEQNWEGFRDLKHIRTGEVTIDDRKKGKLRKKYESRMKPTELNLVEKLLELDPNKRLTAKTALTARYFRSEPLAPDDPAELGTIDLGDADDGSGNFHEFQTKKRRREAKAVAQKASDAAKRAGEDDKEAYEAAYKKHMKELSQKAVEERRAAEAAEKKAAEDAVRREHQREQEKAAAAAAAAASAAAAAAASPSRRDRAKPRDDRDRGDDDRRKDRSDRKRSRDEHSSRGRSDRSSKDDKSTKERDRSSRRDDSGRDRSSKDKDRDRDRDRSPRDRDRGSRDRSSRDRSSRDDDERDSKRRRSRDDDRGDKRRDDGHRRSSERDERRIDRKKDEDRSGSTSQNGQGTSKAPPPVQDPAKPGQARGDGPSNSDRPSHNGRDDRKRDDAHHRVVTITTGMTEETGTAETGVTEKMSVEAADEKANGAVGAVVDLLRDPPDITAQTVPDLVPTALAQVIDPHPPKAEGMITTEAVVVDTEATVIAETEIEIIEIGAGAKEVRDTLFGTVCVVQALTSLSK